LTKVSTDSKALDVAESPVSGSLMVEFKPCIACAAAEELVAVTVLIAVIDEVLDPTRSPKLE
jgi:hypothetical protein